MLLLCSTTEGSLASKLSHLSKASNLKTDLSGYLSSLQTVAPRDVQFMSMGTGGDGLWRLFVEAHEKDFF
jgi:hypothetical protein